MTDKNNKRDRSTTNDPNEEHDSSRRKFIKNAGMIVGGVAGGSILGGLLTNQLTTEEISDPIKDSGSENKYMQARMFFTRYEDFVVLEQATERIYPEDENGPGAIGLDVPYFIDKQLAGPWGINATDYRQGPFPGAEPSVNDSAQTRGEIFLAGLRKMNEISLNEFDTTFDQAEEAQQIEILEAFESDEVDLKGVSAAGFFQLLRSSTLEGAYSDPLYGGNKNMEGWKMKEFPGAVPAYIDMIDSDEFVEMEPVSLTDYQQK